MSGLLDLEADITALEEAPYNPRFIAEADSEALAQSIATLGLVKPIVARGTTIVAGHQRTRALRKLGVIRAPVYSLSVKTTVYDELRMNQLSNGCDMDAGDEAAFIDGGFSVPGYGVAAPGRVRANFRGSLAVVRDELCGLINRFGPWGGVVATMSGEIVHAAQYALAASLTGSLLTVCVLPDDKVAFARAALSRPYGVFNYDGLERHTYVQTLAQMFRLRSAASGKENRSTLYETMVIPYALANPALRYLDFGSGHGDYASAMRRRGLHFHDVELFRRGAGNAIDVRTVNGMIDKLAADLAAGQYDGIVCDSVLNSVDSLEAESAVMTTVNALARVGGRVFFSGRPYEKVEAAAKFTKRAGTKSRRAVDFLDANGFTAIYRQGHWFYQKLHRRAEIGALCERFGLRLVRHVHGGNSWQVEAVKVAELPREAVESALTFEFDMQIGPHRRLGRAGDMVAAYARRR